MKRIDDIEKLLSISSGQMTYEEYELIYKLIQKNAPCSLLIFGLGNDSRLWTKLNDGGYSLFIEDNKEWIEKIKPSLIGDYDVFYYKYNTSVNRWENDIKRENLLNLFKLRFQNNHQNEILYNTHWKIVLVDAPIGYQRRYLKYFNEHPGRISSISTTYSLDKDNVLLHDCDRPAEDHLSMKFFGNDFTQVNRLRYWKIKN